MPKQCNICNYQNESDAMFCNQCGAQLDSRSTAGAATNPGVSGSGWQPASHTQHITTGPSSGQIYATERQSSPVRSTAQTGFPWKKLILSLLGLIMVPIIWTAFEAFVFLPLMTRGSVFLRFLLTTTIPAGYLFWVWGRKGNSTQSSPRGNQMLQGEVRGFRERKERKNQQATVDDTIWTFRLERYQDGRRLSPIPVEMRGQFVKGFINEGDTVSLVDKWRGEGLHRTKKVYNVTNGALVEARKVEHSIWFKLWIAFLLSLVGAFILYLLSSWNY